jgi:dipeptidyl aminopeptidase/acylaminoacyl peptidase
VPAPHLSQRRAEGHRLLWKPKDIAGRKLPLILFNRGGNRDFGELSPWEEEGFYSYVSNGFVVLGSQYLGVDGGQGREELGGADVHDVLNLLPLARAEKLQGLGKTYELVMYAQDSHGLPFHWRDRDRRIVEWLKRYMR